MAFIVLRWWLFAALLSWQYQAIPVLFCIPRALTRLLLQWGKDFFAPEFAHADILPFTRKCGTLTPHSQRGAMLADGRADLRSTTTEAPPSPSDHSKKFHNRDNHGRTRRTSQARRNACYASLNTGPC